MLSSCATSSSCCLSAIPACVNAERVAWPVPNCTVLPALSPTNLQCGLFVAGLWGICLFREIRGARPLMLYWLSGATLVGGAALLAAAKGSG